MFVLEVDCSITHRGTMHSFANRANILLTYAGTVLAFMCIATSITGASFECVCTPKTVRSFDQIDLNVLCCRFLPCSRAGGAR